MGYRETVGRIKSIMRYEVEMKKAFGKYDNIKETVDMMTKQLDLLIENETPLITESHYKKVNKLTNQLLHRAIHDEHPKIFKDLIFHLVKLTGNWNNATTKDERITLKLQAIDRIMRDAVTMADTTFMLKELIKSGKDMLRYRPPLFDVSRHYLESLNEQQSK